MGVWSRSKKNGVLGSSSSAELDLAIDDNQFGIHVFYDTRFLYIYSGMRIIERAQLSHGQSILKQVPAYAIYRLHAVLRCEHHC